MIDRASGCAMSIATMSGLTTSCIAGPMMGRYCTLNIIDEYSRECLVIRVNRELYSSNVIDALSDLFILRGVPSFIRSDTGPEFVA